MSNTTEDVVAALTPLFGEPEPHGSKRKAEGEAAGEPEAKTAKAKEEETAEPVHTTIEWSCGICAEYGLPVMNTLCGHSTCQSCYLKCKTCAYCRGARSVAVPNLALVRDKEPMPERVAPIENRETRMKDYSDQLAQLSLQLQQEQARTIDLALEKLMAHVFAVPQKAELINFEVIHVICEEAPRLRKPIIKQFEKLVRDSFLTGSCPDHSDCVRLQLPPPPCLKPYASS